MKFLGIICTFQIIEKEEGLSALAVAVWEECWGWYLPREARKGSCCSALASLQ